MYDRGRRDGERERERERTYGEIKQAAPMIKMPKPSVSVENGLRMAGVTAGRPTRPADIWDSELWLVVTRAEKRTRARAEPTSEQDTSILIRACTVRSALILLRKKKGKGKGKHSLRLVSLRVPQMASSGSLRGVRMGHQHVLHRFLAHIDCTKE